MNIYDIMKHRRSIRSYKPDPVEEGKLTRILEAARFALTLPIGNLSTLLLSKTEKIKQQLRNAYGEKWFYTAPVVICAYGIGKEHGNEAMEKLRRY